MIIPSNIFPVVYLIHIGTNDGWVNEMATHFPTSLGFAHRFGFFFFFAIAIT